MPRWIRDPLILTLFALTVAHCGAASAQEPSAAMILVGPPNSEGWVYLRGLKDGMEWFYSSKQISATNRPYCVPPDLPITTDQYVAIIRQQVKAKPEDADKPVGLVLSRGLERTFPCTAR